MRTTRNFCIIFARYEFPTRFKNSIAYATKDYVQQIPRNAPFSSAGSEFPMHFVFLVSEFADAVTFFPLARQFHGRPAEKSPFIRLLLACG